MTIGEGIGTTLNQFGSCTTMELNKNNIHLRLSASRKYMKIGDSYNKEQLLSKKYELTNELYIPDVYVINSIDDYKNNYDHMLDTAINYQEIKKR